MPCQGRERTRPEAVEDVGERAREDALDALDAVARLHQVPQRRYHGQPRAHRRLIRQHAHQPLKTNRADFHNVPNFFALSSRRHMVQGVHVFSLKRIVSFECMHDLHTQREHDACLTGTVPIAWEG